MAETSFKALVAVVGVGGVGKDVVRQLTTSKLLSPIFKIVSLTNSKRTILFDHTAPSASPIDPNALISSLVSGNSGPSVPPIAETHEPVDIERLITKLRGIAGGFTPVVLIDCTSDTKIPTLYPSILSAGLNLVTPNKKGFSSDQTLFDEIQKTQVLGDFFASNNGVCYLEATVGAGLPIISTLRDMVKSGDDVLRLEGVFSGTLSFIFNEFSQPPGKKGSASRKFSEIVREARDKGYTEPHPADDLSGSDVARKLCILSRLIPTSSTALPSLPGSAGTNLASGPRYLPALPLGFASVPTESLIPDGLQADMVVNKETGNPGKLANDPEGFLTALEGYDAKFDEMRAKAEEKGECLRYVGVVDLEKGEIKCRIGSYSASHPFSSSLKSSENIISFSTARYPDPSPLIIQGHGAGTAVTAAGVVGDCLKAVERIGGGRVRLGL